VNVQEDRSNTKRKREKARRTLYTNFMGKENDGKYDTEEKERLARVGA